MSILSLAFLVFLVITLVAYYLVPKRIQWWVLLAASVVFYCFAGIKYIAFVAAATIISYLSGRIMTRMFGKQKAALVGMEKEKQKPFKEEMKKKRRRVLVLSIIAIVAFLAFLKYYNFTAENVNFLLGLFNVHGLPALSLILPLGISFYTFQIVAYLVDIYRGKFEAQRNFAKYALFVLFFPQIIEGPIARYDKLAPQLFRENKLEFDNLRYGAQLMIFGFFKKLVIADRLALFVNTVYDGKATYPGYIYVLATALFSIQIYADFSGCMDIVTGAAEMFGIHLAKNFNHPYFSKTMPEFWRRWHISLCEWFKDYVFYPVSASRFSLKLNKKARNAFGNGAGRTLAFCFPILTVWMLTGLWHGSEWNYVAWGVFHGILLILSTIFTPPIQKFSKRLHLKTECFSFHLFQMFRTYLLCMVGRVFFRADGFMSALHIFSDMTKQWTVRVDLFSLGLDKPDFVVALLSIVVLLVVSNLQEHMKIREALARQNLVFRWAICLTAIFIVIIFGIYGPTVTTTFVYEKF
jgi:Predicted membrane protein involved in D-alanine export